MSQIPRAATSPELTLIRTPGQWSKVFAVVRKPNVVFRARINQTFSTTDRVIEITYDTPSGTLANALPDMTVYVGSTLDARDVGVCRLRAIDGSKFYISTTSDMALLDNLYLTVVDHWFLGARQIALSGSTPIMDSAVAYSDQHTNFDPVPVMGGDRVLKKTGSTVATTYDWTACYVPDGSAISTYATTCATASATSGLSTTAPTLTFNTLGWHVVKLVLTAANGKSFFGIRYIYIYDDAHRPADAIIGENGEDVDTGGWNFTITMFDNVDVDTVVDQALVLVFAEDHYGNTAQSIGAITGCENVLFTGWIGGEESINWNPDQGKVQFTCYTAQYFFSLIPSYVTGVEWTSGTSSAWTNIKNLTPRLGLFHFLHWRTTATRVMDVYLPANNKIILEVSSSSDNLWGQLREMTWEHHYIRVGVDRYNRLFMELHPQLTPTASRTWATVMTITKEDWEGDIDLNRSTATEVSILDMSGVFISAAGQPSSYFSLAPGRANSHYGRRESQNGKLVASQAELNTLNGLTRSWMNNPFKDIPIKFSSNMRLIDCFPNQKCLISIAPADTPRGITYSGGIIPIECHFKHEANGLLRFVATFEAETFESIAINGDVPGDGGADLSSPPSVPAFPPLPDFSSMILPIDTAGLGDGYPPLWIGNDTNQGIIYTLNMNDASPDYLSMNTGLGGLGGVNWIGVCPNKSIYIGRMNANDGWIARTSALGEPWTVMTMAANDFVVAAAVNPTVPEQVAFITRTSPAGVNTFHVGTYLSFSTTIIGSSNFYGLRGLSYFASGGGGWLITVFGAFAKMNAAGTSVTSSGTKTGIGVSHVRAGSTDTLFISGNASEPKYSFDNIGTVTTMSPATGISIVGSSSGLDYTNFDCDPTGRYSMTVVGSLGNKAKSSDFTATWAALTTLPAGVWRFAYAGMNGALPRFLGAGSILRATPDFGTNWDEKTTASLNAIAPFPNINVHKFVGLVPYGNP